MAVGRTEWTGSGATSETSLRWPWWFGAVSVVKFIQKTTGLHRPAPTLSDRDHPRGHWTNLTISSLLDHWVPFLDFWQRQHNSDRPPLRVSMEACRQKIHDFRGDVIHHEVSWSCAAVYCVTVRTRFMKTQIRIRAVTRPADGDEATPSDSI